HGIDQPARLKEAKYSTVLAKGREQDIHIEFHYLTNGRPFPLRGVQNGLELGKARREIALDDGIEDRFLVGEAAVYGADRKLRTLGDIHQRGAVEAALDEQFHSRLEDPLQGAAAPIL